MSQPNSITVKAGDLINAALLELGLLGPGEVASAEDASWGLQKLQRLIDRYNARRPMIYNVNFSLFTPPTNTQPVTIGPGAQLDVVQRPEEIVSAAVVINSPASPTDLPIAIRDDDWWAAKSVKQQTSTIPTDLYYSPDWPNGNLYLWPIPTQANPIRLQLRTILAQYGGLGQIFSLPPGYWDGVIYPLAVTLAPAFGDAVKPSTLATLMDQEKKALKAVESDNDPSPRIQSADYGTGATKRGDFNYVSGTVNQ